MLTLLAVFAAGTVPQVMGQNQAVVRLWNFNVHDKKYQQKMYKLFNERNPNIKLEYSSITLTVYDTTLEASFVAKDPPDIFAPSGKMSFTYLKENHLILPLNNCAPSAEELKAWMGKFPPIKYVESANVINGIVYNVDTYGAVNVPGEPLFYNKTLFKQAGIANPPATQSELRQDAAKIAKAGQGKYFGFVLGLRSEGTWHTTQTNGLAYANGAVGIPWSRDFKTGKSQWNSPEFRQTLQLLIDMRKDGSVFPGETSIDDEQAKMTMATNKAAMIMPGREWVPSNLIAYNPDLDFDVVLPPTRDDGIRRGFVQFDPTSAGGALSGYAVAATAKNPRAVWEVIKFISSLEYQDGWVQGGFGASYLPEANRPENYVSQPQMYQFVKWGNDPSLFRIPPVLSEEASKVLSTYLPGIYPTADDVLNNVYQGFSGYDAFKDLDKRMEAALDEGVSKAQAAGVKVTRADFAFPDWDRDKDYVPSKK